MYVILLLSYARIRHIPLAWPVLIGVSDRRGQHVAQIRFTSAVIGAEANPDPIVIVPAPRRVSRRYGFSLLCQLDKQTNANHVLLLLGLESDGEELVRPIDLGSRRITGLSGKLVAPVALGLQGDITGSHEFDVRPIVGRHSSGSEFFGCGLFPRFEQRI